MSLIILFVEVDGNCELIASPKLFLSALIVFNDLSLSKIIVIAKAGSFGGNCFLF